MHTVGSKLSETFTSRRSGLDVSMLFQFWSNIDGGLRNSAGFGLNSAVSADMLGIDKILSAL